MAVFNNGLAKFWKILIISSCKPSNKSWLQPATASPHFLLLFLFLLFLLHDFLGILYG